MNTGPAKDVFRIRLEPVSLDWSEQLTHAALVSVREVGHWMPWCHEGYTRADAERWIKRAISASSEGTAVHFHAIENSSGLLVGGGCLNGITKLPPSANVGYWISTNQTKKGYAVELVRLMIHHGLEVLKLQRLEFLIAETNDASIRLAERSGATLEGILRNRLMDGAKICHARIYSLIPSDVRR